jgi:hypothetical protein
MGKQAIHKIVIQKGRDIGARSKKAALHQANELRDPGKRLYSVPTKTDQYEFVNTEEQDFRPGTLQRKLVAPGKYVITGELREKKRKVYEPPEGR